MLVARLSLRTFGGIMALAALAVAPLWEYGLHDYQKNRVLAFLNPALNPASAWQPRQAMNAVGSGRFLGKGFLACRLEQLRSLRHLDVGELDHLVLFHDRNSRCPSGSLTKVPCRKVPGLTGVTAACWPNGKGPRQGPL